MIPVKVLNKETTEHPPCSIVVHPLEPNLIVFGTYELQASGSRQGSLEFWIRQDGRLVRVGQLDTPESSILDVKMHPSNPDVVLTAQSTGDIIVWRFANLSEYYRSSVELLESGKLEPPTAQKDVYSVTEGDKSVLVLSLSFAQVAPYTTVSATLTSGAVVICKLQEPDFAVKVVRLLDSAHELEAWISTFLYDSDQVLFSGGDDSVLAAHDLRVGQLEGSSCTVWKTRRVHEAGVVSILSQRAATQGSPYQLLTGGYDDTLKLVDLRTTPSMLFAAGSTLLPIPPRAPFEEMNLGGGVWKLVPNPEDERKILACCMYGGARILELNGVESTGSSEPAVVIESLTEGHESMVYGGAWLDSKTVVTCSFYDKVVQVWE